MWAGTMTEQWTMPMDSSLYILEGGWHYDRDATKCS
jgi:hypothetical protein